MTNLVPEHSTPDDFIAKRRQYILSGIGNDPFLLLTATPLDVKDEVIDTADEAVRALLDAALKARHDGWSLHFKDAVAPSLNGLAVGSLPGDRLELFRNGHLELALRIELRDNSSWCDKVPQEDGPPRFVMRPVPLVEYPLIFLILAQAITRHAAITEPIVIGMTLLNAKGLWLRPLRETEDGYHSRLRVWQDDQHLELPLPPFPHPLNPEAVAKLLADRLWNAFGEDACPLFDEDGHYRP